MADPAVPTLDDGVRRRLGARFGAAIEPWFDALPAVLAGLSERWQIELGALVPRGSVSVVIRCRLRDGRAAILKTTPDRARLATEAAALGGWTTVHAPAVLAVDESVGALLIEAIEPGTALVDARAYPDLEDVAELIDSLHCEEPRDSSYPRLSQRVAYLFDSSRTLYERYPELVALVPPTLYDRGRRFATRLAEQAAPSTLLHGDLTPSNILDGGDRGLVAIDPAPCIGDGAFDAVDLLFWQADNVGVIADRAEHLAPDLNVAPSRLLDWCTAFAAMAAMELATTAGVPRQRVEAALTLAADAAA